MSSSEPVLAEGRLKDRRIALVIHSLAGGGAERQMSLLAKYLSKAEATVTLLTLDDGLQDSYFVGPEIDRCCLNLMGPSRGKVSALLANWRRARAIKEAVRDSSPDVIISFCDRTNIITLLACRSLGIPIIISERSDPRNRSWDGCGSCFEDWLTRFALPVWLKHRA